MVKQQEFWVDINLNGFQMVNMKVETVAAKPAFAAADAGRVVFVSTGDDKGFWYNDGAAWVAVADASVVKDLSEAVGTKTDKASVDGSLYARIAKNAADISTISESLGIGGSTGSGESVSGRVENLENAVGADGDAASATGSLYARIAKNVSDISSNATAAANAQSTADTAKSTAESAKSTAEANTVAIGTSSDDKTKGTVYGAIAKNTAAIDELKAAVGDGADGLAAKVEKNTTDIAAVKATADAAAVKTDVDSALANKVDKVTGKSLVSDAEITKLAGIAAGAQVNVIETIKVNSTVLSVADKAVNIDLSSYALKSDVTAAVSSAYVFKGSKTFAQLQALGDADKVEGYVYNVTDSFQEDGKNYPAGTNVAWNGTAWDPLAGYIDTSVFALKTDVTASLALKQDSLSTTQLAAVNSGITSDKVAAYDGYAATIASKVAANSAITGATKCKVTYDSKGLVTAGADLAASDIPALDAAKIASGTFDAARIPSLDIGTKTTGTLASDRLGIGFETVTVTAAESVAVSFTNLSSVWLVTVVNSAGDQIGCAITYTSNGVTLGFGTGASGQFTVRAIGTKTA